MSISQLKQENNRLKNKVHTLERKILTLKLQIQSPLSNKNGTNGNIPPKRSKSVKNMTNVLKDRTAPKTMIAVNINSAKFALIAKLGNTDSQSNASQDAPNKDSLFKKYNLMLRVGVDLSGVTTQMRKDNMNPKLINEFNVAHGHGTMSTLIDLTDPKFSKYTRMKRLKMPTKTITNKMKLDGLSTAEIDAFRGKPHNQSSQDPLVMAKDLGLPSKPIIPKPVNQMKRVHWTPVQLNKIKSSIWNNIDHEWFAYDPIMFESNFYVRKRKEKQLHINSDICTESRVKEQDVQFVDVKRSQMVQIGLKSFNMSHAELRAVILSLNDEKLDVDHLIALVDIVPTSEEQIQAEKACKGRDIAQFGVVERFFYSLYDIIELKERLIKWLFKRQFGSKCKNLLKQMDIINQAKLTIFRSHNLRHILSILLAFGNHMNYGNKKGNAYGFTFDSISLLPQIKTTANDMTFPMFLWAFLDRKYPHLARILHEFKIVSGAAHIDIDALEKKYKRLKNEIVDLNAMIARYQEEYFEIIDFEDRFLNEMGAFIGICETEMFALKDKMDKLQQSERELIAFFGYDMEADKSVSLHSIFCDVKEFINMLFVSKKKVFELEKEQKKKEKRLERKLIRKKKKRANTLHLTRQRFEDLVDKNENDEKQGKHYGETKAIATIDFYNAIKKKGKARKSKHFDRTIHSSFELFQRSHTEKYRKKNKNIGFRTNSDTDDVKQEHKEKEKKKHRRKVTRDDTELSQYKFDLIDAVNNNTATMKGNDICSVQMLSKLSLDCNEFRRRRNSDPGTPQPPQPRTSIVLKTSEPFDNYNAGINNDDIEEAFCVIEDSDDKKIEEMSPVPSLSIDRTRNIRVSIKKQNLNVNKNKNKRKRSKKKKGVRIVDDNKKRDKKKVKNKKNKQIRGKSTRAASNLTASFFVM